LYEHLAYPRDFCKFYSGLFFPSLQNKIMMVSPCLMALVYSCFSWCRSFSPVISIGSLRPLGRFFIPLRGLFLQCRQLAFFPINLRLDLTLAGQAGSRGGVDGVNSPPLLCQFPPSDPSPMSFFAYVWSSTTFWPFFCVCPYAGFFCHSESFIWMSLPQDTRS